MLVANREDRVRPDAPHFGPADPSRSLASRFTGSVQFLGSFVGIPLALLGGYATYSSNFSPEAKCQSLRTSIVSMLDKKADPTTLRLLVQRDVAAFQRECGEFDPDAVAAFKNLLVAERTPAAKPAPQPAKAETKVETKAETPAPAPAKAEPAKVERVKTEPAKAEPAPKPEKVEALAKPEAPKKPQPAPVVVKREAEKPVQDIKPPVQEAKPAVKPEPKQPDVAVAKPAEQLELKPAVEPAPVKQAEQPEAKPVEASLQRPEVEHADSAWIASVRDALRESAARPAAAASPEMASPMPPPIAISSPPQLRRGPPVADANAPPRPPAEIPMAAPSDDRPVPPGAIPDAAPPSAEN